MTESHSPAARESAPSDAVRVPAAYQRPELRVYGDLRATTLSGGGMKVDDGVVIPGMAPMEFKTDL